MSKILVTGAKGQVGMELQFLSSQLNPHDFVFVDHNDLDITNAIAVNNYMAGGDFSTVINCAAYTAVDKAEAEKEKAFLVNAEGAGNVASVCKQRKAKLVHFSTDFIFDGTSSVPYVEDDVPGPRSVYGSSKLAGEKLVLQNNPDAIIIRTSWVYSSFGNNFVKTILKLGKERESLNIIFDQVGTPTYARDLAAAVLEIVQQPEWKPGIYNYSNEGVASWYDFAMAIKKMGDLKAKILPIETVQYPTPAMRPKYSVLNKKKIKETFGLEIPYWIDSLIEMFKRLKG